LHTALEESSVVFVLIEREGVEGEERKERGGLGEAGTKARSEAFAGGSSAEVLATSAVFGIIGGGDTFKFTCSDATATANINAEQAVITTAIANQAICALFMADDCFVTTAAVKLTRNVDAVTNGLTAARREFEAVFGLDTIGVLDFARAFFGVTGIKAERITEQILAALFARGCIDSTPAVCGCATRSQVGHRDVFGRLFGG
jgi:hypothetical protein